MGERNLGVAPACPYKAGGEGGLPYGLRADRKHTRSANCLHSTGEEASIRVHREQIAPETPSNAKATNNSMRNAKGHKQPRTPRRAAQFWAPLNQWWRGYLSEHNRRPATSELQEWYNSNSDTAWPVNKPTWKEARIHAKCLRSTEQVKAYFRAYRARGKAGAGDSSKLDSEQAGSGDTVPAAFESGPSALASLQPGSLLLTSQNQGQPDTLDLLVASHNARLTELSGTIAGLGSPFASQTLPTNTFTFSAPRHSLPPPAPTWQHTKAASERFTGRTSILDGLGAALGDRSLSFGAGPFGTSMSFHPNRADKAHSPFSMPGSLTRERTSCPTPQGTDMLGNWGDASLRSSPPTNATLAAVANRQRRITAEQAHLASAFESQIPGAGLRFTRSFTLQTGPGGPRASTGILPGGMVGTLSTGEWSNTGAMSDMHGGADAGEGGEAGGSAHMDKKELLRMVAQDALGSDSRRSSGGVPAAPLLSSAAAMAAMRGMRRPDSGNSGQPESELAELWALTEDEPSTAAPGGGGGGGMHSHAQQMRQAALMQEGGQMPSQVYGMPQERGSACSDPGPTQSTAYPRSVSFPSASPRTSCLSIDGPLAQAQLDQYGLRANYQRNMVQQRGPLGIASAVAAAAAAAAAKRRSSDSASGDPLPSGHMGSGGGQRSSLPSGMVPRSEYPRSVLLADLPTAVAADEQMTSGGWASMQEYQHMPQGLPLLHSLRVNGNRLGAGMMGEREKFELEPQELGRQWQTGQRSSLRGEVGPEAMSGGQMPAGLPWTGDMEWDRPTM